jgi:hypothetical protein
VKLRREKLEREKLKRETVFLLLGMERNCKERSKSYGPKHFFISLLACEERAEREGLNFAFSISALLVQPLKPSYVANLLQELIGGNIQSARFCNTNIATI